MGQVALQLPQGPITDSYRIYLFVNIIDDSDGATVYQISNPVIVEPNDALVGDLAISILTNDPNSQILTDLNSGDLNVVAKNVIALATVLNIQDNITVASQANQMASLRDFLVAKIADLSVWDISSVKVVASSLSAATGTPEQISSNTAV